MWPMSSARGPPACPSNVAMTVAPRRPAGSGRVSISAPSSVRKSVTQRPTVVDAFGRVAPAVDVDQPLEVGEIGRQVGGDGGAEPVELGRRAAAVGWRSSAVMTAESSGRQHRRPHSGALLSCPDRAPGRDPPARRSQRLPARAGGQARGRHRPAADLVRPARSGAPRPRPPGCERAGARPARRRRGGRRLDPPAARGPRRGTRRDRRPPLLGPRPLDHHLPVDRRGACPDPDRGRARPRRAGRLAVARPRS